MTSQDNPMREMIMDLNRWARAIRHLCSDWTLLEEVEIKVLEIPRELATNGIAYKICTPYEKNSSSLI